MEYIVIQAVTGIIEFIISLHINLLWKKNQRDYFKDLFEKDQKHLKFEFHTNGNGKTRFRLKDKSGKMIAESENYSSRDVCENEVRSIIQNVVNAEIDDK